MSILSIWEQETFEFEPEPWQLDGKRAWAFRVHGLIAHVRADAVTFSGPCAVFSRFDVEGHTRIVWSSEGLKPLVEVMDMSRLKPYRTAEELDREWILSEMLHDLEKRANTGKEEEASPAKTQGVIDNFEREFGIRRLHT